MRRIVWLVIPLLWFVFSIGVQAEETQSDVENKILESYDFHELDNYLQELLPNEKMSFSDMLQNFISGDTKLSWENIWNMITEQFGYELKSTKTSIIALLTIVIIAALFHNFSGVFRDSRSSEIGFFLLYLLLLTVCLNSFQVLADSVMSGLYGLLEFLKLLGPIYFLAVAVATGSSTSVSFYTIVLLLICLVELVIMNILMPIVQAYFMIRILNNLSQEQYLSRLGDFLHTIITWSLKTMLGAVVGINIIQGMLNPAIDSVKRSILTKGGEAIPIIGDLVGGTTEVILGTAKLIKNGIGAVGAVICIVICITPVLKMVVVALLYKLTAALIQPISDKRIVSCIGGIADGATILLKVILTSTLLFLITIAMVATSTT